MTDRLESFVVEGTEEARMLFEVGVMANRQCELQDYTKLDSIPPVEVDGDVIAFASPDSTFAATKPLLEGAEKSILIGIYDFTAGYVADLLVAAVQRGVDVTLMLDVDGRSGEDEVFRRLRDEGCHCVEAPSCASSRANFFPSCHEKVIVVDDTWTFVQSGNWTENSIPENEQDGVATESFAPGNRDMGLAVESADLAAFFTRVLEADIALEEGAREAPALAAAALEPEAVLFAAAPTHVPPQLFPSRRVHLDAPLSIQPVLSPENYVEAALDVIRSATSTLVLEEQYIRPRQEDVGTLLAAIADAKEAHPDLEIRVVLAKPFPGNSFEREKRAIESLHDFGLDVGTHVRLLNPAFFVHCHNKLVLADGRHVLVGSQNWSFDGVAKNREASLLLENETIGGYFGEIFDLDWRTGLQEIPPAHVHVPAPPEAERALPSRQDRVRLRWGDYAAV